jgi:cob(I)alamin adenosyltransferase
MTKIYTKTGDSGTTLFGIRERVPKDDLRIELMGEVDALIVGIGTISSHIADEAITGQLFDIQHTLYTFCSFFAGYASASFQKDVDALEKYIDSYDSELPPLKSFVAPGGLPAASFAHQARVQCRKVERMTVRLKKTYERSDDVIPYLNRLSDYLFTLARVINYRAQVQEKEFKFS